MEDSGLTFGMLLSAVKKRIWIVLAVSAALAAALTLAVAFLYNPGARSYTLSFGISYPGSETQKYPDGTPFYGLDLISPESLNAVKESDEKFASVRVDRMVEGNGISVTAETSGSAEAAVTVYTVTAVGSYFPSEGLATEFLRAVAERPLLEAQRIASGLDYHLDSEVFGRADYDDKISLLARQKESLLEQYDEWIGLYRDGYAVGGSTLRNRRAEVAVLFNETMQGSLTKEYEENGYVSEGEREQRKAVLEKEMELNRRKIEALRGLLAASPAAIRTVAAEEKDTAEGGQVIVEFPPQALTPEQMLAELTVRNVEIQSELDSLADPDFGAAVARYEAKLKAQYDLLDAAASAVQTVSKALFEQVGRVSFTTSRAEQSGGFSPVLAAVGGFVLFFLIAAVAVCCVEIPRMRRKEAPSAEADEETGTEERPE